MSLHKRKITIASKKATHWHFQRLKKILQNKTHQKIISLALILALVTNASPAIIPDFLQGRTDIFSRTAQPAQQQDLVLILAESELMSDRTVYNGLSDLPSIRSSNIATRIERYSTELQQRLHNTKVEIITVSKQDDPATIAAFLKQAYLRNIDASPIQNRYLKGIVLMGEVPLPVVDKNGNRFPSIYPYTDFVDPAYTYNLETGFFELSRQNTSAEFEPEIWHGIIDFSSVTPQTDRTPEAIRNDLAIYLDKNYLYHSGDPNFADFDSKIFYSEPVHEKNALDQVSLSNYEKYQRYSEELLYNRFSQKLFNEVTGTADLDLNAMFPPNDGSEDRIVNLDDGFPDADLTTRFTIAEQLVNATDLFQSSLGRQITALLGTGRFTTSDIFTPIVAIAQKDDYIAAYFKMVNQFVESRINTLVNQVQRSFEIPNGAILAGTVTYQNSDGTTTEVDITPQYFVNNSPESEWLRGSVEGFPETNIDLATIILVGVTPAMLLFELGRLIANPITKNNITDGSRPLAEALRQLYVREPDPVRSYIRAFRMQVFGTPVSSISSANQCRIHRGGGTDNPLDKTVKTTRGLYPGVDSDGNSTQFCYIPFDSDERNKFSTRSLTGSDRVTDPQYCTDFFGANINQPQRVQGVESINKGALTHESCFNMRPVSQFDSVLNLKYRPQSNTPDQIFQIANQQVNVNDITLDIPGRSNIPLRSVLQNLESYSSLRDPADWNAWSFYLLGNPVKNSFEIPGDNLTGINSITLNVQKIMPSNTRVVSSRVIHADPTNDMLIAVEEGEITMELPINATRYVTFLDRDGNTQEIVYPNLFKASSLSEYLNQVRQVEALLSSISDDDYTSQISASLQSTQNNFNPEFTEINQVDRDQLQTFIDWNSFSLSQKYSQIYKNFLNINSNLGLIGFPQTFEMAVITSETDQSSLNLNVLPDDYEPTALQDLLNPITDSVVPPTASQELQSQVREQQQERSNRISVPRPSSVSGCDASYAGGIPVVPWATTYIPCWIASVSNIGTNMLESIRGVFPTYQQKISNPSAEVDSIKLEFIGETFSTNQFTQIPVRVSILDSDGSVIVGKPVQVTLRGFGGIEIPANLDVDRQKEGVQVFMASGEFTFNANITSSGTSRLQASLDSIVNDKTFTIHQNLELSNTASSNTVTAGNEDGVNFTVRMLNQSGQAQRFLPPVVSIENPDLGTVSILSEVTPDQPQTEYQFNFKPSTIAADARINIAYPGLDTKTLSIRVTPDRPVRLYFPELITNLVHNNDESEVFSTQLFLVDQFNNRVGGNLSNISVTVSDSDKSELVSDTTSVSSGMAQVQFRVKPNSFGNVFIQASHPNLEGAIHQVVLGQGIPFTEFNSFASPALYYELRLDTASNSLAQSTIVNGKAQAAKSLSTSLKSNLPVAYIQRSGAIELNSFASRYKLPLIQNEDTYQVAIVDDQNVEIAWVNLDLSNTTNIQEIESKEEIEGPGIYIKDNNSELFEVTDTGHLRALSSGVTFEFRSSPDFPAVAVLNNSAEIARAYYNLPPTDVNVTSNQRNLNFSTQVGPTGNSTTGPQGIIIYDLNRQINSSQKPGSSVVRTDSALEIANQGLHSGGKSLLLFAAGMTAGESNRSFLSDAGLLYGDPTIKLERASHQNGFNQDIGKLIAKTDANINHIVTFEDQVLFADRNGNLSRLDLENQRFYKNLLRVPNGIKQIITSKVRGAQDQLIVLTETGCFDGDPCLYRVVFQGDTVRTEPLDIRLDSKARKIISIDHNNNNSEDLIILTDDNRLHLLRRTGPNFQTQPYTFGNIYNQLQADSTLKDLILLSASTPFSNQDELFSFDINIPLDEPVEEVIQPNENSLITTPRTELRTSRNQTFFKAEELNSIQNLTVNAVDLDGNLLRNNDKIEYRISFRTTSTLSNAALSIPITSNEILDTNSLRPTTLSFTNTTSQERPFIISGINAAADSVVQITFQTTYSAPTNFEPLMTIVVDERDPTPDNLPDLKIVLTGQNKIIYYNSNLTSQNQFGYQRTEVILEDAEVDMADLTGNADILLEEGPPEDDPNAQRDLARSMRNSNLVSQATSVAQTVVAAEAGLRGAIDGVSNRLEKLRCDGKGCLIMPVNRAFLVPSGQPALPIFGAGCPSLVPVWPPTHYSTCSFRQYISPTLTGEFVGASCVGPFMGAACWTYKIGDLGAACDAINNAVVNMINSAVDLVNTAGGGVLTVGGGNANRGENNLSIPGFPSVFTDWFTAQVQEITSKLLDLPDITIIYPSVESLVGYFSPIEEPDPQFDDLGYLGIEDALAKISSIPLFNVSFREHELKYPWIPSGEQLDTFLMNFTSFFDQAITEVLRAANSWGCYGRNFKTYSEFKKDLNNLGAFRAEITNSVFDNPDISPLQAEACIQLAVAFEGFYASFTFNLDALKDYRDLPRNLFTVENFIADYADQALQIAEHVLDRTAGFLLDNTQALIEWQQLLYDIQNIIDRFKLLIDFAITFVANCDDCRTDRTNTGFRFLFEKLIQFPGQIPVIEFPKLPDITLDFSKIEAGIDIVLPTFTFVPERVVLPDIGALTLRLPDAIPVNFDFNFGRYGLSPMLSLPPAPNLEQFVLDLPPLPSVELPVFPVIPRPPSITVSINDLLGKIELPLQLLSSLLRLVCIVMRGVIPTPEAFLRAKIESMTNRPLTPVLPIDLGLSFQFPAIEYSYISEFKIILETYFNYEFDLLARLPLLIVNEFNAMSLETKIAIEELLSGLASFVPNITIDVSDAIPVDDINFGLDVDPDGEIDRRLNEMLDLTRDLNIPDEIKLIATTESVPIEELKNIPLRHIDNIPAQLQQYHSQLLAFRESLDSRSSGLIASTQEVNFAETTTRLVARNIPSFRSEVFSAPDVSNPTFRPEEGIYFIPPNQTPGTESSQKLVAYSAETNLPTNVAMTDYNQNGATDVIYSRGNQIFVKENQSVLPRKNPVRGSVRSTPISSFQSIDKSTLADNKVSVLTENRNAIFSLPPVYSDRITVIDIYNSKFDSESKVNRYIINPFGDAERLAAFEPRNSFSHNGKSIPRDGFNQLYVKNSFAPNVSVRLENLNYRASISTLNLETGSLEVIQQSIPVTPNVCGDRIPPVFGSDIQTSYTVTLYERLTLDFTDITDAGSEVVDIFLDTNLNGQRNFPSTRPATLSRQFILPAFANTGTYRFRVWAVDKPGNRSSIDITINVVPPNLILNQPTDVISGEIDPPTADIPVTIIRDRDGVIDEVGTVNTDADGNFVFDNLVESDSIVIKDASNRSLFEINEKTGSIKPLVDSANIQITQAENPGDLTNIILRNGQQVVTTLTKVSDINLDAQAVTQKPSANLLIDSSNVFVMNENRNPNIQLRRIAGSDPDYAGAISLNLNTQRLALFDTNGGIKLFSPQVTLRLQQLEDLTEYQWYEVLYQGQHVASVLPTFASSRIRFTEAPQSQRVDRPAPTVTPQPQTVSTRPQFQDVDDSNPNASIIRYLQDNDVIEGIELNGQRFFQPFRQITRAEYAKIILRILCLEPTPPSFERPSVFSDIPFTNNLPWYYSETKESFLQRIFTGYLGEIDPISNLPAFKPNNPITLAEATKVVLEALVNQEILNMDSVEETEPWYDAFLEVAQDIRPYLRPGYLTLTDFVVTPEEAQTPNRFITREEFAVIAFRVLQINNCLESRPRPAVPPSQTETSETSTESTDGTDSTSTDSVETIDSGQTGITEDGTDLVTTVPGTSTSRDTNAGLYMQQIFCLSCPCQFRIEYLATVRRNDILYAVIRDPDTGAIIQRSSPINVIRP